jgi:hypothetical protein
VPVLRLVLASLLLLAIVLTTGVLPSGAGQRAVVAREASVTRPGGPVAPLRFGIYPGGGLGTVEAPGVAVADERAKRLEAVRALRGRRSFVVHEYTALTGDPARLAGDLEWFEDELAAYLADGVDVELVLRHRPRSADVAVAVAQYVGQVREVVRRLAAAPNLVGLQITNEPNLPDAPDAGDGASPGVREALVQGVVAAGDEARRAGRDDLRVGFNLAHAAPGDHAAFLRDLRRLGGPAFAAATDFVGVDLYPGTWSGPREATPLGVRRAVHAALRDLRRRALPAGGLGRRVALHVAEIGFPTGPGRTDAQQEAVLAAMVQAVHDVRGRFGVTDLRWFDLRDADSSSGHREHHYGLLRTDFSPKPAFATFRRLVQTLGRP